MWRSTRQRGFSLIEVLVVLVIVSVFIGLTTMSVDGMQSRRSEEELERVRRLLEMAGDYAETRGTQLAVDFLPNGYRFSELQTDGEWHLLFPPSPFAERSWPSGVSVTRVEVDGVEAQSPMRIIFGSEPPEYQLVLTTPEGAKHITGQINGMVDVD
ncbi:prepilin-type N-terminal cleavage/methylation domain-containing protein [Uliginosibacterium gangwonense]|uniref:prepilin-type N-terminal cleavage/methylation domain-containing protein n=1 Tax=Uliginosibacterium gangwonense TaxID=392736 RepID=UPI0003602542|nr:prepilin-type N-terminal cleavage/methylation domain-containing protein [Uliginosibacterium gangwonense]